MQLRPPLIGVTGEVASGKSFVAALLAEQGATVIDADRLGHEVLALPEVMAAARDRWSDEVFSTSGQIDRRRLAAKVFASTEEGREDLRYLEKLTHPRIRRILDAEVSRLLAESQTRGVVIDAPLLVEAGWNEFCDRVVFVEASRAARVARARSRGWSEEEFARREARQGSTDEKRRGAGVVIDNSGSAESTRALVTRVSSELFAPVAAAVD
jgi:dephospho-CoA kinase